MENLDPASDTNVQAATPPAGPPPASPIPPETSVPGPSTAPKNLPFNRDETLAWNDPTQPYSAPVEKPFEIQPREVKAWVEALLAKRVIVVQGWDTQVLFAAEHAIAGNVPFNKDFVRCCIYRSPSSVLNKRSKNGRQNVPEANDAFPDFHTLLDPRFGAQPRLFIVRAYPSLAARILTDSLPWNVSEFNDVTQQLVQGDRYVLILTTPSLIDMTHDRSELELFRHVADFIYPRLTKVDPNRPELPDRLRMQYKLGYWTQEVQKNSTLDEAFYRQVVDDIRSNKIIELIDKCQSIIPPEDAPPIDGKDPRHVFAMEAARIREFNRQCGWPPPDRILEQTALFVVGHMEGLPAEDFDRIVRLLVQSNTRRVALPVRMLKKQAAKTTVRVFENMELAEIWSRRRHRLMKELGLRTQVVNGRPAIHGDAPGDDYLIRQAFGNKYPFTYTDLWRRCMSLGILFDVSEDVAQKWTMALMKRIDLEPEGFGQSFLVELLLSEAALGQFEGDLGERLEALSETDQLLWVMRRVGSLLSQLLVGGKLDAVVQGLDQLISLRAPDAVLRLVRRLSNATFPLANRLKLVQRILNQGGKEHWENACRLLERWCTDPIEGWEAIQSVAQWLPEPGAPENAQHVAIAGVLIPVATRWFNSSTPSSHLLGVLLETAGRAQANPAQALGTLVRWVLHSCFESACDPEQLRGLFFYWLVASYWPNGQNKTEEDKARFFELQLGAIHLMQRETAHGLATFGPASQEGWEIRAAVRECQAVILADWASAISAMEDHEIIYELLLGALGEYGSENTCLQIRVALNSINKTGKWLSEALRDHVWQSRSSSEAIITGIERRRQTIHELLKRWRPVEKKMAGGLARYIR